MATIPSYKASYPLNYYKIGAVYAFYAQRELTSKTYATQDQISQYAAALNALLPKEENTPSVPVADRGNESVYTSQFVPGLGYCLRFYGVVVGKRQDGKNQSITVMYVNILNGIRHYMITHYGVATSCSTDGKELMQATAYTSHAEKPSSSEIVSGITAATSKQKEITAGITHHKSAEAHSGYGRNSNLSGITQAKDAPRSKQPVVEVVSGITRAKR